MLNADGALIAERRLRPVLDDAPKIDLQIVSLNVLKRLRVRPRRGSVIRVGGEIGATVIGDGHDRLRPDALGEERGGHRRLPEELSGAATNDRARRQAVDEPEPRHNVFRRIVASRGEERQNDDVVGVGVVRAVVTRAEVQREARIHRPVVLQPHGGVPPRHVLVGVADRLLEAANDRRDQIQVPCGNVVEVREHLRDVGRQPSALRIDRPDAVLADIAPVMRAEYFAADLDVVAPLRVQRHREVVAQAVIFLREGLRLTRTAVAQALEIHDEIHRERPRRHQGVHCDS